MDNVKLSWRASQDDNRQFTLVLQVDNQPLYQQDSEPTPLQPWESPKEEYSQLPAYQDKDFGVKTEKANFPQDMDIFSFDMPSTPSSLSLDVSIPEITTTIPNSSLQTTSNLNTKQEPRADNDSGKNIVKGRWSDEETNLLQDAIERYINQRDISGNPIPIPWHKIAQKIPHRTASQCQSRWEESLNPTVRKGKWTDEEDRLLIAGYHRYGKCWIRVAEMIGGRTQRQCRTRWLQIQNRIKRDHEKRLDVMRSASPPNPQPLSTSLPTSESYEIYHSTPLLRQHTFPFRGYIPFMHHTNQGIPSPPQSATFQQIEYSTTPPSSFSYSFPMFYGRQDDTDMLSPASSTGVESLGE
ncbi:uncharacterized protein VTP21DRAFT_8643 [Calcarisporiella thermophila]|uniref:uncharacterized protein n=1 Tax=Calcarisporiella thermophila TaxID=911321 RepID=UPI0037420C8E